MFNVKLVFKGPDFDLDQDKVIESWAKSFSEALFHAEYVMQSVTKKPISIDIFEEDRLVASLRTIR